MELVSIQTLISQGDYRATPDKFFAGFRNAWETVRCQALKLETRQVYIEPDNPSWLALTAGDWDGALKALEKSRQVDDGLYSDLRQRGIDFVRCRPIVFPPTDYLRWEYQVYKRNAEQGERIFCLNRAILAELFDTVATHDFMVFDTRLACVHDYDAEGLIQGGWWLDDPAAIKALVAIHGIVKANSQPFERYAESLA